MLDLKALLAHQMEQPVHFQATRGSAIASGYCYGIYLPAFNLVALSWSGANSSNVSASAVLYQVPSTYIPKEASRGTCMYSTNSNGYLATAGYCSINSSGEVKQGNTNNFRAGYGTIFYAL